MSTAGSSLTSKRNRLMLCTIIITTALILPAVKPAQLQACDYYCLRDAAYDQPRDIHLLCMMGSKKDPQTQIIYKYLNAWLKPLTNNLNLKLIFVDTDAENINWQEYGLPAAPPSVPVVVLVGRRTFKRESFYIDHWEPAPGPEDLQQLKTSPVREKIQSEVGRRIAVLLFSPGNKRTAARTEEILNSVCQSWAEKEPVGLAVVKFDRADKRERLLRNFTGIEEDGPDWVAALFGRGKFMYPLEGDEITTENLNEMIEVLMGECTCMRSPMTLGIDMPLIWNEELERAVVPLLESKEQTDTQPATAPATQPAEPPLVGRRLFNRSIATLAAIVVFIALLSAVVLWRRKTQAG